MYTKKRNPDEKVEIKYGILSTAVGMLMFSAALLRKTFAEHGIKPNEFDKAIVKACDVTVAGMVHDYGIHKEDLSEYACLASSVCLNEMNKESYGDDKEGSK